MKEFKPLKLDHDKYLYIGCIPIWAHPDHPKDQSPCTLEDCPHCEKPMWVSEKKKAMRSGNPEKVKAYCLYCLAHGAKAQGFKHQLVDIAIEIN